MVDKSKYQMMNEDSEAVYDEHIAPLMTKIIALCKEHRIPFVASFQLSEEMNCTTRIPFNGESEKFDRWHAILKDEPRLHGFKLTTLGKDGEVKAVEHVVVATGDGDG